MKNFKVLAALILVGGLAVAQNRDVIPHVTIDLTKAEDLWLRGKFDDLVEADKGIQEKSKALDEAVKKLPEYKAVLDARNKEDILINEQREAGKTLIEKHHLTGKIWYVFQNNSFTDIKPVEQAPAPNLPATASKK